MNSNNNCSCPTGVVGTGCHTANIATAPFLRKSKAARLLLSFALVFGVMIFANAIPAFAQTGLAVTKNVVPGVSPQGSTVTVTITIENQDPDHGVRGLVTTNQVPFPGGPITPVVGCATTLAASDGAQGSGPDFTTCQIQETIPITCAATNEFVQDHVDVQGVVDAPGTILDGLPVSGSASFAVIATPLDCNDSDACTTDGCTVDVGCTHTPISCDDGDVCTTDTCDPVTGCAHTAISCDDSDVCTTDTCDPVTGCAHTAISCDDSDACTTDTCDPVTGCGHAPISCDDNDPCTDDTCDPVSGCQHTDNGSCNDQGCTPGFWKNNLDKKDGSAWPVASTTTLTDAGFILDASCPTCPGISGSTTLRAALSFQGGKDYCGKIQILLRAAAAAYLNIVSNCVSYPLTTTQLTDQVNAALATCDPATIIALAATLDANNNLGCPISQQFINGQECPVP